MYGASSICICILAVAGGCDLREPLPWFWRGGDKRKSLKWVTGLSGLMFRPVHNAQEVIYFDLSKDLFRCGL
jgi:hypothetical protein